MLIDLTEPAAYPLTAKVKKGSECDLVMKGGITSGVIYPLAVCQLATTRRLRCVGGTSAGAIAAAGAAAAEYGRDAGAGVGGRADVGYPRLASLPGNLAETDGRHTTLFTSSSRSRRHKRCTGCCPCGSAEARQAFGFCGPSFPRLAPSCLCPRSWA